MTPEQFCYWLQGYFEVTEAAGADRAALTVEQAAMIRQHLDLVFRKVTPPTEKQGEEHPFSKILDDLNREAGRRTTGPLPFKDRGWPKTPPYGEALLYIPDPYIPGDMTVTLC